MFLTKKKLRRSPRNLPPRKLLPLSSSSQRKERRRRKNLPRSLRKSQKTPTLVEAVTKLLTMDLTKLSSYLLADVNFVQKLEPSWLH
jgi:hypothetical protein